jgi:hypothetical protein
VALFANPPNGRAFPLGIVKYVLEHIAIPAYKIYSMVRALPHRIIDTYRLHTEKQAKILFYLFTATLLTGL